MNPFKGVQFGLQVLLVGIPLTTLTSLTPLERMHGALARL